MVRKAPHLAALPGAAAPEFNASRGALLAFLGAGRPALEDCGKALLAFQEGETSVSGANPCAPPGTGLRQQPLGELQLELQGLQQLEARHQEQPRCG